MKRIAAGFFFIMTILIFYFMYPHLKEYMDDSIKMDNLIIENEKVDKRSEIFNLKIKQLQLMNKLLYYGSGIILCIVISIAFLLSYFKIRFSGCDKNSNEEESSSFSQSSESSE